MKPGKAPRVLHYHLGNETEHTVTIHEAELVGLLLGAYLIKTGEKR
jgi:hypothetical protein